MNPVDEAEEREHLNRRDTDEHRGAQTGRSHLGLTRHALDDLADQDAQADAGADRGEAVADRVEVSGEGDFAAARGLSTVFPFVSRGRTY